MRGTSVKLPAALAALLCVIACVPRSEGRREGPPENPRAASPESSGRRLSGRQTDAQAGDELGEGESIFRGTVGGRQVEMRLRRDGQRLTGTYSYARVGQPLRLEGRMDAAGKLTLEEFDASGKQTGRFEGRLESDEVETSAVVFAGDWSRPDGSRQSPFVLRKESAELPDGLRVVGKVIEDRRHGVEAAYPQLVGGRWPLGARNFNRAVQDLILKNVKAFIGDEPPAGKSSYMTSFNVLLAAGDLISVEIHEDSYAGGAHPNSYDYALTYNLREGREIELDELFKPNSGYRDAILRHCADGINRRAREYAEEERRRGAPADLTEPRLFSAQELSDNWNTWGMTREGVVVYLDMPRAIAVFNRNFVPYGALREHLDPKGPAARFVK